MKRPKQLKKIKPWRDYCDWLWAELVKRRAGYESELSGEVWRANGAPGQLHAHHLIDKEVLCYRYEPMNGICLSAAEHKLDKHGSAHRNPGAFNDRWYLKNPSDLRWYWLEGHYRTGPEQDKLNPKLKDYPIIANRLEAQLDCL